MNAELGKFIEIFVMVFLPLAFVALLIENRLNGLDEEINKLKKRIDKLDEETTKKFKEALDVFLVNPKKGNAMLDKIHEEQQRDDAEKFYCEYRDCRVTCDKTCKNCLGSSVDEEGNFYCPYYKN